MATSSNLTLAEQKLNEAAEKRKEVEELTIWVSKLTAGSATIGVKLTRQDENPTNPSEPLIVPLFLEEPPYEIKASLKTPIIDMIQARIVVLESEIATLKQEATDLMNT